MKQTRIAPPALAEPPGATTSEYADVSFLNVQVMVWYISNILAVSWGVNLKSLSRIRRFWFWFRPRTKEERRVIAERKGQLLQHLFAGLPELWNTERVQRFNMPLDIYRIVEWNFARILGAPDRLFEAGFVGGYESKFGSVWVKRIANLIGRLVRFVLNVHILYSRVVPNFLFRLFNKNKHLTCLEVGWKQIVLRTQYCALDAGTELRRNPLDDATSYLWWVTGMVASGGRFWGIKPSIRHLIVQFDLITFLERMKEFIVEEITIRDGYIMVGEHAVAVRSWFRQQDELPFFTKSTNEPAGSMTRPGWTVIADIVAHTPPTELHPDPIEWTVLRRGTRCCAEAGCAISVYEIDAPWWNLLYWISFATGFLFSRVIIWLLGLWTKQVSDLTIQQQEILQYQFADTLLDRFRLFRFPDPEMRRSAERGEAQRRPLNKPVALCVDLAGSTSYAELVGEEGLEQFIQQFYRTIFQTILPYEQSHRGDDEVVVIWQGDAGDNAMIQFVGGSSTERLHTALLVAHELHQRCDQIIGPDGQPFRIRVGIEQLGDSSLWSLEEAPCIIMGGGGRTMNRAARLQEVAKRREFGDPPRPTILRRELAETVQDRWQFALLGAAIELRGINEKLTLVRMIAPAVSTTEDE